jgi:hypothetical protein
MKRWLLWTLVAAGGVFGLTLAQQGVSVLVNGKTAKLETISRGGKVFVDGVTFAKALGANAKLEGGRLIVTTAGGTIQTTQATAQLAGGQGALNQMYSLGKDRPLNFTLKAVELSAVRQTLRTTYIPKQNEKLVILRFSVQNPQKTDFDLDYADFKFTLVDNKDRNYEVDSYLARDGETQEFSAALKPAQRVDVYMVHAVPADVSLPKLIVQRGGESNAPVIRYDLRGKVKGFTAPFADPKDSSGSTVLETVPGKPGTYYPMGYLDGKFISATFSTEPMNKQGPPEGKRYLIATIGVKNAVRQDQNYDYSNFKFSLTDEDGSSEAFDGYLIRANRDERAEGTLKPDAETTFRVYFALSKSTTAKTLTIRERDSRAYSFDLSSAK